MNDDINRFNSARSHRVREMIWSFAGHFDRRTMGPSPDILRFRRTWTCPAKKKKTTFEGRLLLIFLSPDILSSENLPLRQTFEMEYVWRDRRISCTLQWITYGWCRWKVMHMRLYCKLHSRAEEWSQALHANKGTTLQLVPRCYCGIAFKATKLDHNNTFQSQNTLQSHDSTETEWKMFCRENLWLVPYIMFVSSS